MRNDGQLIENMRVWNRNCLVKQGVVLFFIVSERPFNISRRNGFLMFNYDFA